MTRSSSTTLTNDPWGESSATSTTASSTTTYVLVVNGGRRQVESIGGWAEAFEEHARQLLASLRKPRHRYRPPAQRISKFVNPPRGTWHGHPLPKLRHVR